MRKPDAGWFFLTAGFISLFNVFPANGIDLPVWLRVLLLSQFAFHVVVYLTLRWAYNKHTKEVKKISDEYRETIQELYERIEEGGY
ncbi:hypothetical protein [Bacillus phage SDFMU_Pbc]|uniref:Uncharacterized protein n=1 Tax=Bacillus phage SDFMU_Pbc TaxID=3076135 RepID=A0AA96R2S5_9CAUD|nr:hypothetical protein [Bacillus phage SDFMU_Pbc]